MGIPVGNDDEGLDLCAALQAVGLAAATPAAVEWVVTGRWSTPSPPRVEIQWPHLSTGAGTVTAAMTILDIEASIYAAYARMVRFPAGWTDDQRNQYLNDHACPLVDWVLDEYDDLLGEGLVTCGTPADDYDEMLVRTKDSREFALRQALHLLPTQMQTPDDSYFD